MLHNLGNTNTAVIYHNSTVITKVMLLYNTEWQHDNGTAVNYRGKKFYNIGHRLKGVFNLRCEYALKPVQKA